jgi:hypothetical protein
LESLSVVATEAPLVFQSGPQKAELKADLKDTMREKRMVEK